MDRMSNDSVVDEGTSSWMNLTSVESGSNSDNQTTHRSLFPILADLPYILVSCLPLVVEAASVFVNYCVLRAISKLSVADLKSKYLLANSLVIGMFVPIGIVLLPVLYVSIVFGLPDSYDRACLDGMIMVLNTFFQYAQCLSSLALVSDRLYAILAPLTYHVVAYSKTVSICIASTVWLVSAGLVVPTFFLAMESAGKRGVCLGLAFAHRDLSNFIRLPVIITTHVLVFGIYAILFVLVKCLHNPMHRNKQPNFRSVKDAISLAMTFFFVHLSSLCLYIPGPLFAVLVQSGYVTLDLVSTWRTRSVLILLYISNSIIDPLIMVKRIPTIKGQLQEMWRPRGGKTSRGESSTVTTTRT